MINLLVITSLFPNCKQYRHGIFVETKLKKILATGAANAVVIAPVPWFPVKSKYFSRYSIYADVPGTDIRDGIKVYYPRYLVVPKIGMMITPFFMAFSILLTVLKVKKSGYKYDLIDAHYFYPDGVAASIVSKIFNVPLVISALGSDINVITNFFIPKKMILWAAKKAAGSITVSNALKIKMCDIGAVPEKVNVLRNGVDLELFTPLNREKLREKYNLKKKTLISVGNLIELKGHDLIINSLLELPECELLIVGGGELEGSLKELVKKNKLEDRVYFMGIVKQEQLAELFNASDIMVLASSREGWANVLLESMACGTTVAATAVGGTPEVIQSEYAGLLIKERTTKCIAETTRSLLESNRDRQKTREYAELFSWDEVVEAQVNLYQSVIDSHA